jgi:Neocarzinostatin family
VPAVEALRPCGAVLILIGAAVLTPPAVATSPEGQTPGVTVTVTPSDDLSSTQSVQVSGAGFAASQTITLEECILSTGSIGDCGVSALGSTSTNASGSFGPVTVSVTRTLNTTSSGSAHCRIQSCVVRAVDLGTHSAFHHISFAGSPATLTTQASGAVALGGSIVDTATVSGSGTPTGTVTFTLFGPDDATCGGPPVFTSAKPLAGGAATSAPFTPTSAGTYRWRAAYGGDADHNAVSAPCNAPNESVVVSGSGTGTPGSGGVSDTIRPLLGDLTLSTSRFRAAKTGPSVARVRAATGTKVKFSLSEPSTVRFTVERRAVGRKVGNGCVKPKRSNSRKKRCAHWLELQGPFDVAGTAGENRFEFRGRVGGKRLKPGRYRLNGRATDAANNRSDRRSKRFRVVR